MQPVKKKITEKPTGLIKSVVQKKADELIFAVLKPRYVQHPPENPKYNYVTDFYTKWHHSYFYLYAVYCCPFPYAAAPTFDAGIARMEYTGKNRFSLSYMRHNRQWQEIYPGLSIDECLLKIRDEEFFGL